MQGFAATLQGILEGLPRKRQTLLFSATQTRRVADLARLSLSDPEYIAVHADAAAPTPLKLHQACPPTKLSRDTICGLVGLVVQLRKFGMCWTPLV